MRILLTGGGTAGSVVPLLAIVEELRRRNLEVEFLFIGSKKGIPEKELVLTYNLPYQRIHCGKLRRYFDWRNFFDPILLFLGLIESFFIIKKFKPDIILSAGSFVSVPVVWAGWFLGIPSLIHQQDVVPGLANLMMAFFASKITVTFEKSLADFSKRKTILTGNPVRMEILKGDKKRAIKRFNLEENLPTLLVIGGGTGAQKINELVWQTIPKLTKFCQVIHLTGRDKLSIINNQLSIINRYHFYEFLTEEMADAYAIADLVISRAGMGALTELAVLAKPSILIPIADSHQKMNAKYFADRQAAVVLDQKYLTPDLFLQTIKKLIFDKNRLTQLSRNIQNLNNPQADKKMVDEILKICYNR
ncbi:MAG: undecaprenyldiphospho-muramoylpentapeptide beta-N-acetylglucosaminyltransferase [Patescibacteria group bacterium]